MKKTKEDFFFSVSLSQHDRKEVKMRAAFAATTKKTFQSSEGEKEGGEIDGEKRERKAEKARLSDSLYYEEEGYISRLTEIKKEDRREGGGGMSERGMGE